MTAYVNLFNGEYLLLKQLNTSIPDHDYVDISPSAIPTDGSTPQVYVYKVGGASGTTVATITILYDTSSNVISVAKIDGASSTPVNNPATGSVTISGTPQEGQVLTAANTLADTDGIGVISYQWKRAGVAISGATSTTYTLVTADVGNTITVTASYTDTQGTAESVTSSATATITSFVTTTYKIQYTIGNAGTTFELRDSGTVSYDVDWGDGSTVETVTTGDKSHTYASAGIYTVKLDTTGSYYPNYSGNIIGNQIWAVTIDATADLGSTISRAFKGLYNMTSFVCPSAVTSGIEFMSYAWQDCQALTSFPLLNTSTCRNFPQAWRDCSSLSTFPANSFNSTGTLNAGAFSRSWEGCALTAQSIENILTSLDTNGSSNITLGIDGGTNAAYSTWSTAAQTALTNLTNKGWTVTYNT